MEKFKAELRKHLLGKIPDKKLCSLPSGFQRIGDIIILSIPKELEKYSGEIGGAVLKHFGVRTVCARTGGIGGEMRIPQVRVIAGDGSETVHKENGCLYKIDTVKLMFSKGNVKERGRVARLVESGETVIDMFAGIGYFSIPIARGCPGCRVISMELNSTAVRYLRENRKLNRAGNIRIVSGDCRKLSKLFQGRADRIIMGYLPGTHKFLPSAFEMLGKEGTVHYHDVFREAELWKRPLQILESYGKRAGYVIEKVLYRGKVKQFAPRMWHVVLDVKFRRV